MKRLYVSLTGLAALASVHGAAAADVTVSDAWVRETIGAGKVSAGYAHIANAAAAADRILNISTAAGTAELHQSEMRGGMMRMDAVKDLAVPAKGAVDLKPGGYHIMITDIAHPLKVGESVDLVFTFEHAGKITVPAKVAPIAASKAP
jgi:copper(I)-binding protein